MKSNEVNNIDSHFSVNGVSNKICQKNRFSILVPSDKVDQKQACDSVSNGQK